MDFELEKQLERIENTVAAIVQALKKLDDGHTATAEINERLRRFLERKE
ncbi:MAG TPA: hypothetical protein VK602_18330 [Phyllobacterium sp.]|nr:hypothetical protein [Candidatus Saccharimonadales bacterium]HMF69557.1 hypothetical protein [Phyllobacterium sp.]